MLLIQPEEELRQDAALSDISRNKHLQFDLYLDCCRLVPIELQIKTQVPVPIKLDGKVVSSLQNFDRAGPYTYHYEQNTKNHIPGRIGAETSFENFSTSSIEMIAKHKEFGKLMYILPRAATN